MTTIAQYALGIVLFAHGWVHFVYVVSSRGWFGPGEGWGWNGHSWLLSGIVEERLILAVASACFLLVAVGFAVGAVGYVRSVDWWGPVLVAAAILSVLLYVVIWDGQFANLAEKGALGILIDVAVVVWVLVFA